MFEILFEFVEGTPKHIDSLVVMEFGSVCSELGARIARGPCLPFFLNRARNVFGICAEFARNVFRMCSGCSRNVLGVRLVVVPRVVAFRWDVFRLCCFLLGLVWPTWPDAGQGGKLPAGRATAT